MGPTTSQQSPTTDAVNVNASGGAAPRPRYLGRVRAGLLLACGIVTLVALHALALVLLDWLTVAYGLVFGAALAGIWLWTTGTRRLVVITVAAVVSVAAREALLPLLEGTQPVVGIVIGIVLGALDIREVEFWRRLRASQRVVEWPTWRVLRPNVYVRLLLIVPPLAALGLLGWKYYLHIRHERLVSAVVQLGGSVVVAPAPQWWEQLGLDWSYGALDQARIAPPGVVVSEELSALPTSATPPGNISDTPVVDEMIDDLVRQIGRSTSLRVLTLANSSVTDNAFSTYDRARNLREVWISSPRVTDRGAEFLGNQSSLKRLNLTGTAVSGEFLASGAKLPVLERLVLNHTRFSDGASAHLPGIRTLSQLELRDAPITDAAMPNLGRCLALRGLDLSETDVTDAGLQHLTGLSLFMLKLDGCDISVEGVAPICQATSLYLLSMAGTDVSAGDLSQLTGVYVLSLRCATLGSGALEELAQINTLMQLDLSNTDISDADIETLRQHPNFGLLSVATVSGMGRATPSNAKATLLPRGVFSLRGTRITDQSLPVIGSLKYLRSIDLSETDVTDAGVRHLADMPHLDTLYLGNTAVTDATLDRLHGLANLSFLNVSGTQVTEAGVRRLQQAKPNMTLIHGLDDIAGP